MQYFFTSCKIYLWIASQIRRYFCNQATTLHTLWIFIEKYCCALCSLMTTPSYDVNETKCRDSSRCNSHELRYANKLLNKSDLLSTFTHSSVSESMKLHVLAMCSSAQALREYDFRKRKKINAAVYLWCNIGHSFRTYHGTVCNRGKWSTH